MKQNTKNTQRFLLTFILLGILVLAVLVMFFGQPFSRYSASAREFTTSCRSLIGKDLSLDTIKKLNGYCFESCGNGCSHAVACQSSHLLNQQTFVVTQNPGAPEGWYCSIKSNNQKIENVDLEFVTD